MISVLIPVFNRNVEALVSSIHLQLIAAGLPGEIIVMDDCSTDNSTQLANKNSLTAFPFVKYIALPVNTGRNTIRHKLAAAAAYNKLIFIDADSSLPDAQWLQRYIDVMAVNNIVMGGRLYRDFTDDKATLHLHYGKMREQKPADVRKHHPWRSFLACNFLISKQQLGSLIIDQRLQGYCHEDTFMGLQFKKLNTQVLHIDNPVYHEGIDEDQLFIKKQEEALENLFYLWQTYHSQFDFKGEIKLINVYRKLVANNAGKLLLNTLSRKEKFFKQKALGKHHLFWLDAWKLAVYHRLSHS